MTELWRHQVEVDYGHIFKCNDRLYQFATTRASREKNKIIKVTQTTFIFMAKFLKFSMVPVKLKSRNISKRTFGYHLEVFKIGDQNTGLLNTAGISLLAQRLLKKVPEHISMDKNFPVSEGVKFLHNYSQIQVQGHDFISKFECQNLDFFGNLKFWPWKGRNAQNVRSP